jgi:hypothetical protein
MPVNNDFWLKLTPMGEETPPALVKWYQGVGGKIINKTWVWDLTLLL